MNASCWINNEQNLTCTTAPIKTCPYLEQSTVAAYWSQQQYAADITYSSCFTLPSIPPLPLTLPLPLLSGQFQTWEISRSQQRGVAGWNQSPWMEDVEHTPTQHLQSMLMKWPRGTSENLWCSLEDSIAFQLDLIQVTLSQSKLIPAWKVRCKHQSFRPVKLPMHIFNMKSRWCKHASLEEHAAFCKCSITKPQLITYAHAHIWTLLMTIFTWEPF